jgi:hypothetical protein
MAAPNIGLRMAGPLPAEKTPLFAGDTPRQSLKHARSVAKPVPAGKLTSQSRNRHASWRVNDPTSSPDAINAWVTMQVCSVSSETIPRPNIKR